MDDATLRVQEERKGELRAQGLMGASGCAQATYVCIKATVGGVSSVGLCVAFACPRATDCKPSKAKASGLLALPRLGDWLPRHPAGVPEGSRPRQAQQSQGTRAHSA